MAAFLFYRNMRKTSLILVCLVSSIISFWLLPQSSYANEQILIKVGYINGYGLTETNGIYSGYTYEFLTQLNKYADFEYEFIAGDWNTNIERLANSEVDVLVPLPKSRFLADLVSFPDNDMGHEYLGLYTLKTNETLYYDDFDNFEGMKVGAFFPNRAFDRYMEENNFSAEYVFFENLDEMRASALSGKIDTYILESSMQYDDVKMVAKLAAYPFFLGVKMGNTDLLDKINQALNKLWQQDLLYTSELHKKYYGTDDVSATAYTKAEKMYIEAQSEIVIALASKIDAVEFYDEKTHTWSGIVPDILHLISEKSGLNLTFVPAESTPHAMQLLKYNAVSAATGYVFDSENYPYEVSDRLMYLPLALIGKDGASYADERRFIGVDRLENYIPYLETHFPGWSITLVPSDRELFEKINIHEAEIGLINSYSMNAMMAQNVYPDINFIGSANIEADVRLILALDANPLLLSVLNKTIQRISADELNAIVMKDSVITDVKISLLQILNQYLYWIIFCMVSLIAVILIIVLIARKKTQQKLYQLAYYDSLTGAPNADKFNADAESIFIRGLQKDATILHFDIENFKRINEFLGYETGNQILIAMAELCRSTVKSDELFARVAADTFVLFLKRSDKEIRVLMDEFGAFLRNRPELSNFAINPRLEWGLYIIKNPLEDVTSALDKASHARKLAKKDVGKHICVYDDALQQQDDNLKQIESNMHRALEDGAFTVYLQPKVHMKTHRLIAAEALVRWVAPDGSVIWFPNDFIGVFEKNGFIAEIDAYILNQVCTMQSDWKAKGISLVPISVNQSKILINKTNYTDIVLDALKRHDTPNDMIEIEITETILHENFVRLTDIMQTLSTEGFTFSIDDFGSGYSSLALISKIPANILKIDRSILLEAEQSERGRIVLRNSIRLADDVGLTCICEGVETQEQESLLLSLGCKYAQGYYYGRPMSAAEFEVRLIASKETWSE